MTLNELKKITDALQNTPQMPALFVGHGSPMNAIEENSYVLGWRKLGRSLPTPTAILSISAHWLTKGTKVHITKHPKTIHDFFGFPKELYGITYDCLGSPEFALQTKNILTPNTVTEDSTWGMDHGTWVVLRHMFPDAHIPVFQMSIAVERSHEAHYALGKLLAPLRKKGVLIMGSGNLVHNLGHIAWGPEVAPFDWATSFDAAAEKLLVDGNHPALINYEKIGVEAKLAIPTPDHYLPLLYVLGLQGRIESVSFPVIGIAHGSISMRAVKIG